MENASSIEGTETYMACDWLDWLGWPKKNYPNSQPAHTASAREMGMANKNK